QVTAVAEDLIANLTAARSIDQDPPGRHLVGNPPSVVIEANHIAVFRQQDLRRSRNSGRHPGVPGELPVLSMYRHEMARSDERKHELELLLATMAGDMDVLVSFGNDLCVAPRNVIDDPADRLLV